MKFTLRPWALTDLASLVQSANNVEIARCLRDAFPHPYTTENGQAFLKFIINQTPTRGFAIEVAGHAVGSISLHPQTDIHCKNAELGYWLAQPFWGQNIITQAIGQIVLYGFHTFDIARIFAPTFSNNLASHRTLEKAGFLLEARFTQTLFKNGEFLDEWVYAIRRK
jgi:RimJ/RimL family protein N-acetyltransferase